MTTNRPIRILLVEDNPDHVEITIRALKSCGCVGGIDVVTDGDQAINYLHGRCDYADREKFPIPDLILLDIKLPKVDGIEVLRQIKHDPVLKIIPVIILTTSASDRDITDAYTEGANSYISKPVSFKKFIAKITDLGLCWADTNTLPSANEEETN